MKVPPPLAFESDLEAIFDRSPPVRRRRRSIGVTMLIAMLIAGVGGLPLINRAVTPREPSRPATPSAPHIRAPIPTALPTRADRGQSEIVLTPPVAEAKTAEAGVAARTQPRAVQRRTSVRRLAPTPTAFLAQPTTSPNREAKRDGHDKEHGKPTAEESEQTKQEQRDARLEALDAVRALRLR